MDYTPFQLEVVLLDNKREFYRLTLFGEEKICVQHSEGEIEGTISDISATGVSFLTKYEIDFSATSISFRLDNQEFTRTARLIRKKSLENGETFYAVNFLDFTEKERQLLFQTLLKVEAQKRLGGRK